MLLLVDQTAAGGCARGDSRRRAAASVAGRCRWLIAVSPHRPPGHGLEQADLGRVDVAPRLDPAGIEISAGAGVPPLVAGDDVVRGGAWSSIASSKGSPRKSHSRPSSPARVVEQILVAQAVVPACGGRGAEAAQLAIGERPVRPCSVPAGPPPADLLQRRHAGPPVADEVHHLRVREQPQDQAHVAPVRRPLLAPPGLAPAAGELAPDRRRRRSDRRRRGDDLLDDLVAVEPEIAELRPLVGDPLGQPSAVPRDRVRSPYSGRLRYTGSRNRVSGGMAIRGCACSITLSSVVPERGHPTRKIGRSAVLILLTFLPHSGRRRLGGHARAGTDRREFVRQESRGNLTLVHPGR